MGDALDLIEAHADEDEAWWKSIPPTLVGKPYEQYSPERINAAFQRLARSMRERRELLKQVTP